MSRGNAGRRSWTRREATDETRAMAAYYTKEAKKIVEPKPQDMLNAAKNYVVAKRIMAAENCQTISLDCLGLVAIGADPLPALHRLVAAVGRGGRGHLRGGPDGGHFAALHRPIARPPRLHAGSGAATR